MNEGDEVRFFVEGNQLIVTPVRPKKYTLSELLEGMSKDNLHSELDWGEPQGREIWEFDLSLTLLNKEIK